MKVIVVDNSKLFQRMLVEALEEEVDDINLVVCENSVEALAVLESETIDFICVSMHFKDGNGISLTKTIRATNKNKHTPIVLFTSEDTKDIYTEALKSGVTEVFNKKDLQQLINFIQRFTIQQQKISGHVLVVEDTQSQREMLYTLFTERGLEVDAFATAEEAFESFLKHDYDLVVTDIVLEGRMTGMMLTNYIRRLDGEKGDVPILALTGFDDISRRIELFYLGVSDYVIKPLIEQELLARVRNLIRVKQLHFELIKQKKRAEKADKAKSLFLSNMSHELRTPLNAILGFGQIIAFDKDQLSSSTRENIDEVLHAGNHLLSLINEILDLATIESGKVKLSMEAVDVGSLMMNCVSFIEHQASEKQIEIIDNVSNQNFQVCADKVRLKQVFLNLLSNAVKYNKSNGSITLSTNIVNGQLRIYVIDTGEGLNKEQLKKLFIPFERLVDDNVAQGTGIGLVITKTLIELMSGSIGVDSVPGEGCRFWVQLKLYAE